MSPSAETSEWVEYSAHGITYRIAKTDPPTLTVTVDHGEPENASRPQTWAELNALFAAQEILP